MPEIDRRRYTEPELRMLAQQGQLPGFESEAVYGPQLFQDTAWQPVHNIAFMRVERGEPQSNDAHISILATIRTQEGNDTHADVVSTPTRRMFALQAQELIADRDRYLWLPTARPFTLSEVNPSKPQVIAGYSPNTERLGKPQDVLPRLGRDLFAAKLGLRELDTSDQLGWGGLGMISLSKVVAGFSYVSDTAEGEPQYEPIVMFGSVLSTGVITSLLIPSETVDYRNVTWTDAKEFAKNVKERNVGNLVIASEHDLVVACVRGLCLATSVQSTLDLRDIWDHMGYREGEGVWRHFWDPTLALESRALL